MVCGDERDLVIAIIKTESRVVSLVSLSAGWRYRHAEYALEYGQRKDQEGDSIAPLPASLLLEASRVGLER